MQVVAGSEVVGQVFFFLLFFPLMLSVSLPAILPIVSTLVEMPLTALPGLIPIPFVPSPKLIMLPELCFLGLPGPFFAPCSTDIVLACG